MSELETLLGEAPAKNPDAPEVFSILKYKTEVLTAASPETLAGLYRQAIQTANRIGQAIAATRDVTITLDSPAAGQISVEITKRI